jgi:hypothetical protein
MLGLQEISDRLELQQLVVDYASAIDQKDFEALDRIFTPDAFIDYRPMGGTHGNYPEVKAWLKVTLVNFPRYYHMVSNVSLKITGDTATGRIVCFNPMCMDLPDVKNHVMFFGLWYMDQYLRTPEGWRITERIEDNCFNFNMPGVLREQLEARNKS